ncbi:MAG: sigma 54-interacting transcriptional regulator [Thermodesulfobacteriota bacterium]|nr:sigma 54-interacting transcriptional regulator [Thermodesulfobacteriota bacterium]
MTPTNNNAGLSVNQLKTVSTSVTYVNNLNHLLEMILETGNRIMGAGASSLLLLDKKTGSKLQFKVATGEKKESIKQFEVKVGQGIAGHVAKTGTPLLIGDAAEDSRWYGYISNQIDVKIKSIACVPMLLDKKVIGVIEFMNKADGSAFQESELELLRVFADLAAIAISNARQFELVEKENQRLREELAPTHQIVGESRAIQNVISEGMKVADSMASTLILGESGTGKELLARLIHQASPRSHRPLVTLNCAALPESLLEAELFGYEKGAFTGATRQKTGKFELADNGTIFLDEIAEMSPQMQAKLLRILQDGIFYRVGGNSPISVDIRVIAATNKDIAKAVKEGQFREDLYYRLNVVEIHMPPLRERKEDIRQLANHFVQIFQEERAMAGIEISDKAMSKMKAYDWPGNVRELKNAIERAVVMGNGKQLLPEDLPMLFSGTSAKDDIPVGLSLQEAVDEFKKRFIELNLKKTDGNQTRAAKTLGIQRSYLSRLISRYRMEKQSR